MTREERAYNYASKKNPTKFTVGEIAKHYDDGYQDAISKACEWLKSYRQDTPDGAGYIAGIVNDKTIEDFKKAMEE